MAVVDLTPLGGQQGTLNGAIFTDAVIGGAGSGNLEAFLSIGGNLLTKQGYNSDVRPVQFTETNSATFNHDLPLSAVPIAVIGGIAYREFVLDTNEEGGLSRFISLNRVEVYQSAAGDLSQYPFTDATGPTATLVYNMDAGTSGVDSAAPSANGNWVHIDNQQGPGGGNANAFVYVPNSLFAAGGFVTLFSRFGDTAATDDGPEEWAVRIGNDIYSIAGRKFHDLDGDGTDDGGTDPGLAGWTIFADADDDGALDPGEPTTVTGADGSYTLPSLVPGPYNICEVQQAGWTQTFPQTADGCHVVTIIDASLRGIDFGNRQIRPGIDLEKLVNGQDADLPTGPILTAGSLATFTYVVTNTGNVALGGVVVLDDNGTPANLADDFNPTFTGGDTNGNGLLDVTETWSYSAVRTVVVGQYTNLGVVTSSAPASDSDPANYFGAAPAIDIEKLVNGQDADLPAGPILAVGGSATFTYVVTNTGNVALSGVVVLDDNGTPANLADDFNPTFTGGDTNGNGLLDLTETWTYSAVRTVVAGQYTNLGSVAALPPVGAPPVDSDPANYFGAAPAIDIEKLVNGQDADLPTGPILGIGSIATFTYVVTNTGNIALSSVSVLDDNGTPGNPADDFNPIFTGGDTNGNGLLDLGEAWGYAANRIVTAGQYTNIGSVVATTPLQTTVTDSDAANHFGAAAAIDIEKLVNGVDADAPTGPLLPVGSTATFTYVVTNAGNGALASVLVIDDNGTPANLADDFAPTFVGGDANVNGLLDVGEVWTYTAARIVTAGQYTNVGFVTAFALTEAAVGDSDAANHFGVAAAIDIEKLVNGEDADVPMGPFLDVGSTATFTYVVSNTGNVALSGVVVVDDNGTPANPADDFNPSFAGGDTNANGQLDVGEAWTFTAARIVTAGQYTNIGTVAALSPIGTPTSDSDAANHFGSAPAIDIEKLVNGQDADLPPGTTLTVGSTATFTYLVTNTGNVVLSGVTVIDDNGTPGIPADDFAPTFVGGDVILNGLLDLGETWTFTAARIVTAGQYTNVGAVTALGPNETTVADSDAANFFGRSGVIVVTPDKGNASLPYVHIIDATTGELLTRFLAYAPWYRGGVRVATGDLNGDGIDEIVVAPGRNHKPLVKVFDQSGNLLKQFLAFGNSFKGGVDVAVGDVNGDGRNDIAAAMSYAGSQVKVFKNTSSGGIPFSPLTFAQHSSFYPFGSNFKGGAVVELADLGTPVTIAGKKQLNSNVLDGKAEVIVGNEAGIRSTVKAFTYFGASTTATAVRTFLPFNASFRGGLSLDVARINADLVPDIIVGAGPGGNSQVQILDGRTTALIGGFSAFTAAQTPSYNAPVDVAASDEDGDGIAEFILAAQGTDGSTREIRRFDALSATLVDTIFESDPDFGGAYFLATLRSRPLVPILL